jgi:hypothetical protein
MQTPVYSLSLQAGSCENVFGLLSVAEEMNACWPQRQALQCENVNPSLMHGGYATSAQDAIDHAGVHVRSNTMMKLMEPCMYCCIHKSKCRMHARGYAQLATPPFV